MGFDELWVWVGLAILVAGSFLYWIGGGQR